MGYSTDHSAKAPMSRLLALSSKIGLSFLQHFPRRVAAPQFRKTPLGGPSILAGFCRGGGREIPRLGRPILWLCPGHAIRFAKAEEKRPAWLRKNGGGSFRLAGWLEKLYNMS